MPLVHIRTPQDFALAQEFVSGHETTCVSLASKIRKNSDSLHFLSRTQRPKNPGDISGVIHLDSTIYHCIPGLVNPADFLTADFCPKKPVHCVSGEADASKLLEDFLARTLGIMPLQATRYKMLRLRAEKITLPQVQGEIIRCTENDMDLLRGLQKEYMKEEMMVPGRKITDAEVSIMLRQILRNQLCLALIFDGEAVAKANTNAIGFNCVQIGGVFTNPLYRRNGYAAVLVQTLCLRARRAQKLPVLFVKEKNDAALALYQKIGFEECGRYEIAYY